MLHYAGGSLECVFCVHLDVLFIEHFPVSFLLNSMSVNMCQRMRFWDRSTLALLYDLALVIIRGIFITKNVCAGSYSLLI